jgi:hypothetical protein
MSNHPMLWSYRKTFVMPSSHDSFITLRLSEIPRSFDRFSGLRKLRRSRYVSDEDAARYERFARHLNTFPWRQHI